MQEDVFEKLMELGIKNNFISDELLVNEDIEAVLSSLNKEDLINILKEVYEEFVY